MNIVWLIVAGVVVIATGKVLFCGGKVPSVSTEVQEPNHVVEDNQLSRRRARFPLLCTSDPFDHDGALVWRTQLPMFAALLDHEPFGMTCAEIKPVYNILLRQYPEIYDGYSFRQWGELLLKLDLLRVEAKRVHITRAGRALHKLLVNVTKPNLHETNPQWLTRLDRAPQDIV